VTVNTLNNYQRPKMKYF